MTLARLAVATVLIFAALAVPAPAQEMKSENVEVLGKFPEAVGVTGARFSPDGKLMYVAGTHGLGIYDIAAPEAPARLSRLPLPHFENEDVDVGRDVVVITNDPSTTLGGLGDIVAVTEEDYAKPTCEGQGSLQTWQITDERNSDGSRKLKMLDMWTTELNELAEQQGRSPVTGNCSAHWFDEDKGLLAQGWYDQGVRFMDITKPKDIRQIGFYATAGTFWGAYFAPTDPKREIVYAVDTAGGVDVLGFDRSKPIDSMPEETMSRAEIRRLESFGFEKAAKHQRWGFACALPVRAVGT